MRRIDEIIVHCSATPEGRDYTVADITRWHCARGFRTIGYHYVIYRDGTVHTGRPLEQMGAHCARHNAHSIGICYIGGCVADGRTPKDTRTPEQKDALCSLLRRLKVQFPNATIHGHRDYAAKACPSYNATQEYRSLAVTILLLFPCFFLTACRTTQRTLEEKADSTLMESAASSATSLATDKFLQSLVLSIDSIVVTSFPTQLSQPPQSETAWFVPHLGRTSDSSGFPSGVENDHTLPVLTSPSLPRTKMIVGGIRLQSVTADSSSVVTATADTTSRQASHNSLVRENKKKEPSLRLHLSLLAMAGIGIAAIALYLRKRKVST